MDETLTQNECRYCHRVFRPIYENKPYDALYINLTNLELVSVNRQHAFPIQYCPMCGRKLSDSNGD